MTEISNTASSRARVIIQGKGGTIRTSEALKSGIHPRTIYQLRDRGDLVQISRGIYRLSELKMITNPDLVVITARIPRAVICLVSALAFHEITSQIPHHISIALPAGHSTPRLDHPPFVAHRFSENSFAAGIEVHIIDGVKARIYSPEKTIADCFKFRNKIGMDIVLESLKYYRERMPFNSNKLMEYGRICRVEKVMKPYLEASL